MVEVGRHVADNCVWIDYETCCAGHCFAWMEATYCSGGTRPQAGKVKEEKLACSIHK